LRPRQHPPGLSIADARAAIVAHKTGLKKKKEMGEKKVEPRVSEAGLLIADRFFWGE
jgi:hypothetical protein